MKIFSSLEMNNLGALITAQNLTGG